MEMPRVSIFRSGIWVGCMMKVLGDTGSLFSRRVGRCCTQQSGSLQKERGVILVYLMSSESSGGVS